MDFGVVGFGVSFFASFSASEQKKRENVAAINIAFLMTVLEPKLNQFQLKQ